MKYDFDITELKKRESERVEWKKNVADINDVIKTIVAFTNDYSNFGGGYVVCGAEETQDSSGFQHVTFVGLTSSRYKEIEGKVLADCKNKVDPPIIPLVDEIEVQDSDKRVLIFIVPSSETAHSFRASASDSSKYYVRIGRSTHEARNGILRELLVRKRVLDPWDRRSNHEAKVEDVDLILLRDYLQTMSLWDPSYGVEKYISSTEPISAFVPPLFSQGNINTDSYPRNFTLLLFSSQPTRFVPGAYTILSVYPGEDRSAPISERNEITGSIVEQTKQILTRLNIESQTAFDKTSPHPNQIKYPQRALQEAVVNAIVHRDYESDKPIRITVFSDRVEINSPGSLPTAVDNDQFLEGKACAYWRNQSLAFFFNKLQYAQAEGQGIPTIYRTMKEEGCPSPIFNIGEENLICVLPAHPRHKQLVKLREIENDYIIGNYKDALLKAESLINDDPQNYRALELYCEVVNMFRKPRIIYEFIVNNSIDLSDFPSSTKIIVAETLLNVGDKEIIEYAQKLFEMAVAGQLEEKEIKKIAVGLRKIGDDEKAINVIDNAIERVPSLESNSSLLEIRAKAKIELAKRCIDTAKKRSSSRRIKYMAWEKCRNYLNEAEKDLTKSLHFVHSSIETEFIQNDMDYLTKLKIIAQKPKKK